MGLEYEQQEDFTNELEEKVTKSETEKSQNDGKTEDNSAPNPFAAMFNSMGFSSGSLSGDAANYYQEILEQLDFTRLGYEVKVRILSIGNSKATAVVYYAGKYAVSLIMAETFTTLSDDSPAMLISEVKKAVRKEIDPVSVSLDEMVVFPSEYNRRRQMADWIEKLFSSRLKFTQKFTMNNMKGHVFNIELSTRAAEAYRKTCPLTPARHDLTLAISLTEKGKKDKNDDLFGNKKQQRDEGKVLAYITGFAETIANPKANRTDYGRDRSGKENNPYLVIFRVTEILPVIPDISTLGWALPIIVDQFGKNRKYLAQFANYASGYNAGVLCGKDDNGKLRKITSQEEFEVFHNNWLTEVAIALDVSLGRPSIPGLTKLISGGHAKIIEALGQFLTKRISTNEVLGKTVYTEYGGLVKLNGEDIDSRSIDFISFADKYASNIDAIKFLLRKDPDPIKRFKHISSTIADIKPAYIHRTFMLDPGFIKTLVGIVNEKHLSFRTTNNKDFDEGMDMSDILSQAAGLSSVGGISSGFNSDSGIIDDFFDDFEDDADFY